jgi:hypothetical protein
MRGNVLLEEICNQGMTKDGWPLNNISNQIAALNGGCLDWRVIKSKTKIKAL